MLNNSSSGKDGALTVSQMNRSGNTGGVVVQRDQMIVGAGPEIHAPVVSFCDMRTEMKEFAFEKAQAAFGLMFKQEKKYFKDVAEYIKRAFDERFPGTWSVIVGRNFGSYVTYESKCIIQFWINHICFLIFKFA